jgi:DMSO/TMAO reductase YedYZ molybdopterin-dependent catalytic subunit
MSDTDERRREVLARLLGGLGAAALTGCDAASRSGWFPPVLGTAEDLSRITQRLDRQTMAQEFTEADLSPEFRSNGSSDPGTEEYRRLARNDFADWSLQVGGLVGRPASFSLATLRAMPSRTQITRHDCVEGWSAIGKWTGVPLREVLDRVVPRPEARYVVFHCADPMDGKEPYYESIDFDDAYHPQTILAYGLNDETLPIKNGAPLRVRIERQLGYKMAKYLMRLELVSDLKSIRGGKGGYWEDRGYEWYAGI